MPKLFDLLSDRTDKNALNKIQKKAKEKKSKHIDRKKTKHIKVKAPVSKNQSSYIPNFVALDVETTGLNHNFDSIIEIGAIKFINGKPRETYKTFVNPDKKIPSKITDLTSISDDDVKDAPSFGDVADDLLVFIGHLPLCGHQVEFDYNFINSELKRIKKEKVSNSLLDTALLSRLLLAGLPGYSLGVVARHLNVILENAHRALDDAIASGHIAVKLIPKLYDIPVHIRTTMAKFASHSLLKKIILRSIGNDKESASGKPKKLFSKSGVRLSIPEEPVSIAKRDVVECFSESGFLSQSMESYIQRPSQINMATSVSKAVNSYSCFVAEAGTGTGKSLAYLIPSALWALKNSSRVLISTHTKNLQDQLITKDLPLVQKAVGKELTYSVLKGRSNYLCINRWQRFLSGELGNISPRERIGILPLIRWAEETTNGDIEEQNQFNRKWFAKVWSLIAAESHGCSGRRCPHFHTCFLQYARQKALCSNIVIINHALFFSEICAGSSNLGKTGTIIFDEAHHIESCGHQFLRVELDTNRIIRYIDTMNNLVKIMEKNNSFPDASNSIKQYKILLKRMRKNSTQYLSDVSAWAVNQDTDVSSNGSDVFQTTYKNDTFIGSSGFAGLELIIKDMQDFLHSLQQKCTETGEETDFVCNDITSCMDITSQIKADAIYLTNAATEEHVFWIEGSRQKKWIKLCGVPLDIGKMLNGIWKENQGAHIFTSATLAISGSINYFKTKIGLAGELEDVSFEIFNSPFFSEQTLRLAVKNDITPDKNDFPDYVAKTIASLLSRHNKNILVLFTANKMLLSVHQALKEDPAIPIDASILAQGVSGSRIAILDKFIKSEKCVLLGTSSFWEGIDVPGKACEIVIIPRLPFPVPTHPLTMALSEKVEKEQGNSFFKYSVPEAVIRFKQGAGRLIRTANDLGSLIVLDSRIITKPYGKIFKNSLDGEFVTIEDENELHKELDLFFMN